MGDFAEAAAAEELRELREQSAALRRLILAVEASGQAILPGSGEELLQTIVEAAARIFGAAAASIALRDEQGQALEFRVAYGAGRDEVIGLRIPAGQGIAGYVAATGQPMAISDVGQDTRFARATAEKTGYVPRSILAMPLLLDDRVIGVIEVLDKINAAAFGMQDMELLALFARQAALAIAISQRYDQLGAALSARILELLGPEDSARLAPGLKPELRSAESEDVLRLARLFNAISGLGDAERRACLQILDAFAGYVRGRPGLRLPAV
jgi:GAF domain-containing protein